MKEPVTNDMILESLRDLQDREHDIDHMPFMEWRDNGGIERDISAVLKAHGSMAGMAHVSPGFGMMGSLGTSSRAPAGPNGRRSGLRGTGVGGDHEPKRKADNEPWFGSDNRRGQQYGVPSGVAPAGTFPSKYNSDRPDQPSPWIDDVNMESIWYSPFQPVWPFGPPFYNRPREWNYPVGYNLNFIQPRMEAIGTLRGMRASWGVLSTIIETRKDQLLRLPWTIQRRDKPRASSKAVDELRKFFRRPDRKLTYGQWSHKVLDDAFVIDAPSIFIHRAVNGKVLSAEAIDGGTIFPLIDDAGRRPDTIFDMEAGGGIDYIKRQPAFQQIIYGLPMIDMSEDELIYAMQRPQPDMPMFGYSPVQQIMIEATEAIRKTFYQLEFWREGSIPEMIVTVPDAWSPRQIAQFQGHFDALLSGQLSLKSKVRFVPGGMKPFEMKNASGENLWSDRDEMLVRLACYAFSVSPTPFVKQTNRGTANAQAQTAQEEGLYPLMSWWKDDIMDTIIQEKFGYDDLEFVFLPRPEVDLEKQAKIHQIKLQLGEMTLDEARAENGEEPLPDGLGAVPLVYFGSGAVRLEDVISGKAALPGAQPNEQANRPGGGNPAQSAMKPNNAPQRGAASARVSNKPAGKPTPIHKALVTHRDLKDAAKEAERNPSHHQKKIGNYKKGHISIQGLPVTIENAKGSKRGEKRTDGDSWQVKMPAVYGYIRGFIGADDMHIDCYVGKCPQSPIVYVIDQDHVDKKGRSLGFDEHKCMIGYKSPHKAIRDYRKSHFDGLGLNRIIAVTVLSMVDFKNWLRDGDLHKPISDQGVGTVLQASDLAKADTISASSGLGWYDQRPSFRRKRKKKKSTVELN